MAMKCGVALTGVKFTLVVMICTVHLIPLALKQKEINERSFEPLEGASKYLFNASIFMAAVNVVLGGLYIFGMSKVRRLEFLNFFNSNVYIETFLPEESNYELPLRGHDWR